MKNKELGISNLIKGVLLTSAASVLMFASPSLSSANTQQKNAQAPVKEAASPWSEFQCNSGKCKMNFPVKPEHVSEKMNVAEEGYDLRYDAYIASLEKQAVFMLLIAQYPDFVDESYAHMSLEGFLNGILSHNPNNQLIFADLLLVEGHEALDFFIRTGSVYFKGRALMVKNHLYLMAMECEMQNYDESRYNTFVNSFKLSK